MAKETTTANSGDQRDRNLKLALGQIEKEFGKGSIMRLGDQTHDAVPVISSGAMALDIAMGVGGFPRGRVLEIFGPESSGKTTVCLHVVANAQRAGGVCAYIDTEHALDPRYAKIIGVNTDDLLISQPDCGEDALNITDTLVRSNAIDVLVIDSVAALVPRAEIEGQMGDSHVGLQARLMSQALRKLTAIISKSRTCVVFTNQIREKIGVMFGSPETTTGGRALKFYASIRLDIRRIATIKAPDGQAQGSRVKVKVVKNKLAAPFRECEFDIMYDEGISRAGSILDVALDMKLLEKRGSWFSFEDVQVGQGREQTKKAIEQDLELQNRLITKIRENLPEHQGGTATTAAAQAADADDVDDLLEEDTAIALPDDQQ
ncbi:recombinase RecA [Oligosphaera ethanolica]|uniref:Protein RecA n=1 Tax=Oligosphaera ethanolica TaxID=760260 RepID=A0AAE4AP46_9BACT|nr:recombinase RecA [Oligosphaera ethanolica]MDQ0289588.1 recombination protein RecA [Oligosphaera ethanolica]